MKKSDFNKEDLKSLKSFQGFLKTRDIYGVQVVKQTVPLGKEYRVYPETMGWGLMVSPTTGQQREGAIVVITSETDPDGSYIPMELLEVMDESIPDIEERTNLQTKTNYYGFSVGDTFVDFVSPVMAKFGAIMYAASGITGFKPKPLSEYGPNIFINKGVN